MTLLTLISYILLIIVLIYIAFREQILDFVTSFQKFKCIRCGHCCLLVVRLTDKDVESFKKHKLDNHIEKKLGKTIIKRINNYCPFLIIEDGKSRCKIYKIRPLVCQKYPLYKKFFYTFKDHRCTSFKLPKIFRYL